MCALFRRLNVGLRLVAREPCRTAFARPLFTPFLASRRFLAEAAKAKAKPVQDDGLHQRIQAVLATEADEQKKLKAEALTQIGWESPGEGGRTDVTTRVMYKGIRQATMFDVEIHGPFGTFEHPVEVPSSEHSRLVLCVGDEHEKAHEIVMLKVDAGHKTMCAMCGQFFVLHHTPAPEEVMEADLPAAMEEEKAGKGVPLDDLAPH